MTIVSKSSGEVTDTPFLAINYDGDFYSLGGCCGNEASFFWAIAHQFEEHHGRVRLAVSAISCSRAARCSSAMDADSGDLPSRWLRSAMTRLLA